MALRSPIPFLLARKGISFMIVLALAGGGYYAYRRAGADTGAVRYTTAAVEKGTLVVSVAGTGQVSSEDQVDIKPKVSGTLSFIAVVEGKEVKAGAVIARLDSSDALKAVRDAETSLETAKLTLEKLKQPPDDLTVLQSENSLAAQKEARQRNVDDLDRAYEDGYNGVTDAFLTLPDVMTNLNAILYGNQFSGSNANVDAYADAVKTQKPEVAGYRDIAVSSYADARTAFDAAFARYKTSSRNAPKEEIESLIEGSYDAAKLVGDAIKEATNLVQFYKDAVAERGLTPKAIADTHIASLTSYAGKTSAQISSLLSDRTAIQTAKESIVSSDRTIAEREASLAKLYDPPDALDLRAQELTVRQRQEALDDARMELGNYAVVAPFGGMVVSVDAKRGDDVSTGTAIATLVTKQRIAEITLNEIDAATLAVGQKATLTFDAIEDLTVTGAVSEIDSVGAVSQGVVSFGIKVSLDTQDERVKPGMTVSASVVTDVRPDVLLVPNAAVKRQASLGNYVDVMPANASAGTTPERRPVAVGLANDTMTEILEGLEAGELVVTATVTGQTSSQPIQNGANRSIFSGQQPNARSGGGNAGFMMIR